MHWVACAGTVAADPAGTLACLQSSGEGLPPVSEFIAKKFAMN